jgi:hypothetical protein
MESLAELLLASLDKFYSDPQHLETLRALLESRGSRKGFEGVSLRLIDWAVTNYAKKNSTSYSVNDAVFFVHSEYRAQLKSFSKKNFDVFKRGPRISFRGVQTCLCQLNFLRWAIKHGVVDFCARHVAAIETDMDRATSIDSGDGGRKRSAAGKEKRTHLTKKPSSVVTSLIRTRITFA